MRITQVRNPFSIASFLLGNFAALWGFIIAPIYLTGFGLLLSYSRHHPAAIGQAMILPLELPLIGLILASLGFLLSSGNDGQRDGRLASCLGLAFNGLPMALAVVLWVMNTR